MRVQKYPAINTYANTWPTAASVPAGVVTEEMTPAAFAAWLAAQPAFEVQTGPATIELWQARTICTKRGKDAAVTTGIATLTVAQQQLATARWNFGGSPLQRDEWFVKHLRVWMGYTNKQMDNFFTVCAEL